jgi:hypothetical protein
MSREFGFVLFDRDGDNAHQQHHGKCQSWVVVKSDTYDAAKMIVSNHGSVMVFDMIPILNERIWNHFEKCDFPPTKDFVGDTMSVAKWWCKELEIELVIVDSGGVEVERQNFKEKVNIMGEVGRFLLVGMLVVIMMYYAFNDKEYPEC